MARDLGSCSYGHGDPDRIGVLLGNLGTPDAPTPEAVRRYLAEFLSDPRVIELPRLLWWPILHGILLRTRPHRSALAYQKIWTHDGSPLRAISERQASALQAALDARFPGRVKVALGMRYGRPSIRGALDQLRLAGVRRLLVFPLYPQYSATTTASTFDAVAGVLKTWRRLPETRMVLSYHDEPAYIHALAGSIRAGWSAPGRAQRLLFSFHGIPRAYFLAGDPYFCHCHQTARLVAERLDLDDQDWQVAFQSRLGPSEWLGPYTIDTLRAWAGAGVESVDVLCPGFSADCLETLEEIDMQNRDAFIQAGGQRFRYIPALNDTPPHIEALADIAARHMLGWSESL